MLSHFRAVVSSVVPTDYYIFGNISNSEKKITYETVASSEKRTSSTLESEEAFLESDDESSVFGTENLVLQGSYYVSKCLMTF